MAEKHMAQEFHRVAVTVADIVKNPSDPGKISGNDSQLIYGERVQIGNQKAPEGWAYVTSCIDDYKGFIKKDFLQAVTEPDTHFVEALSTHIYPEPSFKARPIMPLSFLSRLQAQDMSETDGFIRLDDNKGWVFKDHIKPLAELKNDAPDPVDTALRFMGTPYLYGGRTSAGLDCSALIQLSLLRAGLLDTCPRDTTEQEPLLGKDVTGSALQKGDIVFFPGHVGIMKDEKSVINATARKMATVTEPLGDLVKTYGPVTSTRRFC